MSVMQTIGSWFKRAYYFCDDCLHYLTYGEWPVQYTTYWLCKIVPGPDGVGVYEYEEVRKVTPKHLRRGRIQPQKKKT